MNNSYTYLSLDNVLKRLKVVFFLYGISQKTFVVGPRHIFLNIKVLKLQKDFVKLGINSLVSIHLKNQSSYIFNFLYLLSHFGTPYHTLPALQVRWNSDILIVFKLQSTNKSKYFSNGRRSSSERYNLTGTRSWNEKVDESQTTLEFLTTKQPF